MNRLNKAISNVAYILDSLTLLRQVQQTGDCNICKNRDCGYAPKVGQMVRYNCPFYQAEIDANPSSFSHDHENDLISRQAAIDALKKISFSHWFECGEYLSEDTREIKIINSNKALEVIEALPSAQPEVAKDTNVPINDYISRQAAIDALGTITMYKGSIPHDTRVMKIEQLPSAQPEPCKDVVIRNAIIQKLNTMDRYVSEELRLCDTDKKFPKNEVFIVDDVYEEIVENLPSAQLEPLTDTDQRIFLAAMEREEKVCEEVDRNHVREQYEDSLVRVCKEIRRKVKGALWT